MPPPAPILAALLALAAPLAAADPHHGHGHGDDGAHAHGGLPPLGSLAIGPHRVEILAGERPAEGEWHLGLRLQPAAPPPAAIRAWIGAGNGRGARKSRAEPEAEGGYGVHLEIPAATAADDRLWIAIELPDGGTARGSLPLPPGGHRADDGHRH